MPKMKSHSGSKKRFKVTKRGKVLHKAMNRRHILTKKSNKRKRQLRGSHVVHEADAHRFARLLPYA